MSLEVVDVPNEKMEIESEQPDLSKTDNNEQKNVVTQEIPETKQTDVKTDVADKAKNKTPEPEAKRPRGRTRGTKYPQTKYVYVDRDKDVSAKIDQLANQLNDLKVTSNTNPKQVERTPTPEPGAEQPYERNHIQQRMDRLQARKQNYSNLFNSIHK